MGILDSFQFSPQTYGSNNPLGWLGMLLNSQPGQSQGFQDQLPPQAAPAMGQRGPGVNLPQMGTASYGKDLDASNPLSGLLGLLGSSPGATAALPGPAVSPPSAGPGLGDMGIGLLNHLQAGAANLTGSGNPLAGIVNAIGGLATGQRTDATGYMLQQQKATLNALIQAGVPPAVAQAAALNPEILKTIAPQIYTKPEFKTLKNALGEDVPVFTNADKGTITYPTVTGGGAQGAGAAGGIGQMQQTFDQIESLRNQGAPTPQMLQAVPNSLRSGVEAMLSGGAIPSNLSNRGAARDLTLRFAHAIDPAFDESLIPARVALQKSYQGGGKNYQETLALNTVGGHLLRLKNAVEGLDNSSFKPFNKARNLYSDIISDNPALVKFRNDLVTTQNELAKAYHGGHVSDAAFSAFNNSINEAQTPDAMRTAVKELAGLLQSKITANETGYKAGMNGLPLPSQYRAINDEARHSFETIDKWGSAAQKQEAQPQNPMSLPAPDKDGWIQLAPNVRLREKK